jgi:hypothetical protein
MALTIISTEMVVLMLVVFVKDGGVATEAVMTAVMVQKLPRSVHCGRFQL